MQVPLASILGQPVDLSMLTPGNGAGNNASGPGTASAKLALSSGDIPFGNSAALSRK
jgi:hypothetical protein